jgi:hypothetical protein
MKRAVPVLDAPGTALTNPLNVAASRLKRLSHNSARTASPPAARSVGFFFAISARRRRCKVLFWLIDKVLALLEKLTGGVFVKAGDHLYE